jgi:hypothetical protein
LSKEHCYLNVLLMCKLYYSLVPLTTSKFKFGLLWNHRRSQFSGHFFDAPTLLTYEVALQGFVIAHAVTVQTVEVDGLVIHVCLSPTASYNFKLKLFLFLGKKSTTASHVIGFAPPLLSKYSLSFGTKAETPPSPSIPFTLLGTEFTIFCACWLRYYVFVPGVPPVSGANLYGSKWF